MYTNGSMGIANVQLSGCELQLLPLSDCLSLRFTCKQEKIDLAQSSQGSAQSHLQMRRHDEFMAIGEMNQKTS